MLSHLFTVFMSPRATMEGIRDRPRWAITLLLALLLFGACMAITAHITGPEQMQAALDGPFGDRLASDPNYSQRVEDAAHPTIAGRILKSGLGPMIGAGIFIVIIGSLWHLVCRMAGGKGRWAQTMGVIAISDWLVLGLRQVLLTPVILAKGESMTVSFSLAAFMREPDVKSVAYRALAGFTDVFSIWGLVITVIGFGVVHAFNRNKALAVGIIPWFVVGLIGIGIGSLFM